MKHLKTFRLYEKIDTDHKWDLDDTIILYYIYRLQDKYTSITDSFSSVTEIDHDKVDLQLKKDFSLGFLEIAEDLIGCSEGAMNANLKILEYLNTGKYRGFKNANQYQKEVIEKYSDMSLEDLKPLVDDIITKIWEDKDRMAENQRKKDKRIDEIKIKRASKEKADILKSEKERMADKLKSDLKRAKVGKVKSAKDIKCADGICVGDKIIHPKFGPGEVVETDNKFSTVEFTSTNKKLANSFIKDKGWLVESSYVDGSYPGPPIVNQAASNLAAGASDGMIGGGAGFGMTGAMGGEFPKKSGPTSKPYPDKFKQTIKQIHSKETKNRKDAIKKIQQLDTMTFDEFKKKKDQKERIEIEGEDSK